jgi:putative radical SAM enzyme (TIGR03279 family)
MSQKGIRILAVERGSVAESIGLAPGDRLLEADGHRIADELSLRFYLAGEIIDLLIRRADGREERLEVDLSDVTNLGIQVEEFRTRTCNNACLFCFVDQLPPGVRPALRIKDDDYRLSFLYGNYITLTNLNAKDISRIIEHRLSPLHISVHATDPDLRARILGREKADDLKRKIQKLVKQGIRLHAQIVLMPGMNDGKHLEKTVMDLHRYYPGVQSVAVVPLGLSDYGPPKDRLKPVTPAFCRRTILQVKKWQDMYRSQTGETFVYLADEFYLQGGVEVPETSHYDDFAQVEDGVGMIRTFLDEFESEWERHRKSRLSLRGTLITGKLFHPILQACISRFNRKFGSHLQVREAENIFMGKTITVAGLLAGKDILNAVRGEDPGDFIVIPHESVSQTEGLLLDDSSLEDLSDSLGKPVFSSGPTVQAFFRLMKKQSAARNRRSAFKSRRRESFRPDRIGRRRK